MTHTFHPEAEADLREAVDRYTQSDSPDRARKFLNEFERVVAMVTTNPEAGPRVDGERRMYHLTGYPYTVIYKPLSVGPRILVVHHQHRSPKHGNLRR